jgi:hypothetical protein
MVEDKFWQLKSALLKALENIWYDEGQNRSTEDKKSIVKEVIQSFGSAFEKLVDEVGQGILRDIGKEVSSMNKDDNKNQSAPLTDEAIKKMIEDAVQPVMKWVDALTHLSVDEFEFVKMLSNEEKDKFLDSSEEDRKKVMKKKTDSLNSESLTVDGVTITKAEVGEGVFAVLKKQQESIQATKEENKKLADDVSKEVAKRREIELAKKAEEEYSALPGDPIEKGRALGYVEALPKEAKEVISQMLKAGNEALAKGMNEFGHNLDSPDNPENELNKLAIEKAQKDGITYEKAYDQILMTTQGQDLYNRRGRK